MYAKLLRSFFWGIKVWHRSKMVLLSAFKLYEIHPMLDAIYGLRGAIQKTCFVRIHVFFPNACSPNDTILTTSFSRMWLSQMVIAKPLQLPKDVSRILSILGDIKCRSRKSGLEDSGNGWFGNDVFPDCIILEKDLVSSVLSYQWLEAMLSQNCPICFGLCKFQY